MHSCDLRERRQNSTRNLGSQKSRYAEILDFVLPAWQYLYIMLGAYCRWIGQKFHTVAAGHILPMLPEPVPTLKLRLSCPMPPVGDEITICHTDGKPKQLLQALI